MLLVYRSKFRTPLMRPTKAKKNNAYNSIKYAFSSGAQSENVTILVAIDLAPSNVVGRPHQTVRFHPFNPL